MDAKFLFSLVSGIFSFGAFVPYIRAILQKRSTVKPNRASWFAWWLIDVSSVAALWAAASYQALPMFIGFSIGSTMIFFLSIKKGEGGFKKLDIACVLAVIIGLALWIKSGDPVLAIVALMASAIAATAPTIEKSWRDPESEDLTAWSMFATGGLLGILAITDANFAAIAPPVNVFLLQLNIVVPLALHHLRKRKFA